MASADTSCSSASAASASAVVACGQRHIRSPKTGLTFPAWLLKLPSLLLPRDETTIQPQGHDLTPRKRKTTTSTRSRSLSSSMNHGNCRRSGTTRSHSAAQPQQSYTYVWRSKRDFLLLSRAAVKYTTTTTCHNTPTPQSVRQFPKSAFDKLARRAIEQSPWRRPLLHETEKKAIDDDLGDDSPKGVDENAPNSFHVSMKKSILQLDQFLQSIQHECENKDDETTNNNVSDNNDGTTPTTRTPLLATPGDATPNTNNNNSLSLLKAAWYDFCRPHPTKDLVEEEKEDGRVMKQPETSTTSTHPQSRSSATITTTNNKEEEEPSSLFLQQQQQQQQQQPFTSSSTPKAQTTTTTTSVQDSSRLGQYFCTNENAKQLVKTTLHQVNLEIQKKMNAAQSQILSTTTTIKTTTTCINLLFVEPSCGKGDVIRELIHQLKSYSFFSFGSDNNNSNSTNDDVATTTTTNHAAAADIHITYKIHIIGCDIDPCSIQYCQETFEDTPATINTAAATTSYHLVWICQDFLQTHPSAIIRHEDDELSSTSSSCTTVCCCVGGPPYTSGAGSGGNFQTDLPQLFLWHCIHVWRACSVSFLVPKRYEKNPMKVGVMIPPQDTKEQAKPQPQNNDDSNNSDIVHDNDNDNDNTNTDDSTKKRMITSVPSSSGTKDNDENAKEEENDNRWVCETQNLSSSTFYFQGKVPVVQPSVLQCFYRRP